MSLSSDVSKHINKLSEARSQAESTQYWTQIFRSGVSVGPMGVIGGILYAAFGALAAGTAAFSVVPVMVPSIISLIILMMIAKSNPNLTSWASNKMDQIAHRAQKLIVAANRSGLTEKKLKQLKRAVSVTPEMQKLPYNGTSVKANLNNGKLDLFLLTKATFLHVLPQRADAMKSTFELEWILTLMVVWSTLTDAISNLPHDMRQGIQDALQSGKFSDLLPAVKRPADHAKHADLDMVSFQKRFDEMLSIKPDSDNSDWKINRTVNFLVNSLKLMHKGSCVFCPHEVNRIIDKMADDMEKKDKSSVQAWIGKKTYSVNNLRDVLKHAYFMKHIGILEKYGIYSTKKFCTIVKSAITCNTSMGLRAYYVWKPSSDMMHECAIDAYHDTSKNVRFSQPDSIFHQLHDECVKRKQPSDASLGEYKDFMTYASLVVWESTYRFSMAVLPNELQRLRVNAPESVREKLTDANISEQLNNLEMKQHLKALLIRTLTLGASYVSTSAGAALGGAAGAAASTAAASGCGSPPARSAPA